MYVNILLVHCFKLFSFTAIMCLDLPNPQNGRIDFSIDETAFFDYNTNATYVCDIGYGLTDEGAVRICGGDETSTTGVWSGDSPTCEGVNNSIPNITLFISTF